MFALIPVSLSPSYNSILEINNSKIVMAFEMEEKC